MISGSDLNQDVVVHEFFHALGFTEHFSGFGDYLAEYDPYFSIGDSMSYHAVDVMRTLYSNPIGSAANNLTIYASATPAIPEPETNAMMLAGLGLVGFMAKRRKQVEA